MSYLHWWRRLLSFAPSPEGQHDARDTVAIGTPAPTPGVGTLDGLRSVFWQGFCHLFPPHAQAAQMPNGSIVVSWPLTGEPDARRPYAAPVVLRFEEALLEAMSRADPPQRLRIAQQHEGTLREGLRGYDPFAQFPNARIVTIG